MNNTQHTLTTDLAHLTQINDLLHDFNIVAAQRDELLAALRQFECALIPVDCALGPTGEDVWPEIAQAIIRARAAIAKAEGQS